MNTFQISGIPLAVHTGNEDIAKMCAEHGIAFSRPEPPADTCIVTLVDNGWFWVVQRFFHADGGYAAFGIPASEPVEQRKALLQMILETVEDSARAAGEADAGFSVHPLGVIEGN